MSSTKFKNKMLSFLLMFTLTFLLNVNVVKADSDFTVVDVTNLYERCSDATHCVPLCIYETTDHDSQSIKKNSDDFSYIGYYYDEVGQANGWEIGFLTDHNTIAYIYDSRLPKSSIYWEDYGVKAFSKRSTWNTASEETTDGTKLKHKPYLRLYEDFECPKYQYADYEGYVEACFANQTNKCEKQDNAGTDFGYSHPLKYSFVEDELKKVIDDTYNELYIFDSTTSAMIKNPAKYSANSDTVEQLAMEKINFLSKIDPNLSLPDETKTAEENAKEYCKILKEELENGQDQYVQTLMTNVDYYKSTINEQLKTSAVNNNSRIAVPEKVYNIDTLNQLLILSVDSDGNASKREITDNDGNYYIDKVNSIFSNNVDSSVNYVTNICNNMTEYTIDYDREDLKNKVKNEFETTIYEKIQIDQTTEFSCGTLGELADMISTAYFIIEIVAIIILVVFTALDYAKVIISGEHDEMKKTNKRLVTRLIITVVILLLPALVNFTLEIFNIEGFNSDEPLCVEIKNK